MTLVRVADGLRRLVPVSMRSRVMSSPAGPLVRRLDPGRRSTVAWPLHGPLEGMQLYVHDEEERRYVQTAYEPLVAAALESVARPGMRCADVGANVGYFSLLLARCVAPGGSVVAFEAQPENAERARRNVALNGLDGTIAVVQAAVCDRGGTVALRKGATAAEFSIVGGDGAEETVPAVTLDEQFADGRLDLVKIDVEGAEELVLRGMTRLLAEARPVLLIELHGEQAGARALLEDAGYAVEQVDGDRFVSARPR